MSVRLYTAGFSAVELLITLFVAAAFIGTGYQLYTIIINNGAEARFRARASNIAYDNLRRYSPQATNPCTVFTPSPTPSIPAGSGLPNPSITITITCPYGSVSLTRVVVSVKYGNTTPQQEVVHGLFIAD